MTPISDSQKPWTISCHCEIYSNFGLKSEIVPSLYLMSPLSGFPLEFYNNSVGLRTRVMPLLVGGKV